MKKIKNFFMLILFYAFRVFPIAPGKIVICSYMGRGYGGEGKIICDKLLKTKNRYDIVWLVRNINEKMPEGVRKVKYLSLKSIYEQATAKIWIDNRRKPVYVRKRDNQYYLQAWHGDIAIKYVEKDAGSQLSANYIRSAKNDSRMANAMLAGTKWRKNNFQNAFWFDGEILEGDLYQPYYLEENREKNIRNVRTSLGIREDLHIVTYAPTFRKNKTLDSYDIDFNMLLHALEQKYGGKWIVAVRLHPNIASMSTKIEYSERIINASLYPQINDLVVASEILITDYSGCMFDGYRAGKKVFIYASDYDEYTQKDRGLYFRFEDLPAPIAKNNHELEEAISSFDEEEYEKKRTDFVDSIGYYDADGAEVVSNWINQKIGHENN